MVHIVYMKEIILAEPFFLLCVNGPLESQSIKGADVLGRRVSTLKGCAYVLDGEYS